MISGSAYRMTPAGIHLRIVFITVLVSWKVPPVFLGIHVVALIPVMEKQGMALARRSGNKENASRIL